MEAQEYTADKLAGKTIGKYHVETLIGEGGMAYVYKGRHVDLDNVVAIKVLFPEYLRRDIVRTRFKREARLQCKLNHPNIVRVVDLFEEDRLLGMVMDLVDGGDLSGYLKRRRKAMTLFTVRRIFLPLLDAMAYAHSHGVIHRDLKPHNIMLHGRAGSEVTKVMDFGIARSVEDDGFNTKTGVVIGTPYYISPEQAMASKDIDLRTDVYALGVTLFQMLTGNLPFVGESAVEVISGHCFRPVPSVRDLRPDLGPGIDAVVQKAMAKEPPKRYQDCEEFAKALEKVLPRRGGDTASLSALPNIEEVHRSREDLDAVGLEDTGATGAVSANESGPASQDSISLHTRIEGWKQSKEPHPPLPSVSSSLDAVPDGYEPRGVLPTGAPASRSGGPVSQIASSPKTTSLLLVAIILILGGVGTLWAMGAIKLDVFRKSKRTQGQTGPAIARTQVRLAQLTPRAVTRAAAPQPRQLQPRTRIVPQAPTKRVPHKRSTRLRRAPPLPRPRRAKPQPTRRRARPRPAPRRVKPQVVAGSSKRCGRCIKRFFNKLEATDLQGSNPHALGGGACNYNDFLNVAKQCSRTCGRSYLTFCKGYLAHKTGQCQQLVRNMELMYKLRSRYPDSNQPTAIRCTSGR